MSSPKWRKQRLQDVGLLAEAMCQMPEFIMLTLNLIIDCRYKTYKTSQQNRQNRASIYQLWIRHDCRFCVTATNSISIVHRPHFTLRLLSFFLYCLLTLSRKKTYLGKNCYIWRCKNMKITKSKIIDVFRWTGRGSVEKIITQNVLLNKTEAS